MFLSTLIEDIAKAKTSVKHLAIKGNAKNISKLRDFHNLEKLEIYTTTQAEFDEIISYIDVRELKLYELRVPNLDSLSSLKNLEKLDLEWNTKAISLWDVSSNTKLTELSIIDFPKLYDLSQIEHGTQLQTLTISGGVNSKMRLESLKPLESLKHLEFLEFGNLSITDSSLLQPIGKLKNLKHLTLSNQFPTEEYARLSIMLPDTECNMFQPFVPIGQNIGNNDVMVVGSRKPFLNSKQDKERLERYALEFKSLQEIMKKD